MSKVAETVQMAFPRIYLACHTRHQRRKSTVHKLSPRDAAILAHLDKDEAITPRQLARHLGIAASTLSEALKRLARRGFILPPQGTGTKRLTAVRLSALGVSAIKDTSVLETERLETILSALEPPQLNAISVGLSTLADACRLHGEVSHQRRGTPR